MKRLLLIFAWVFALTACGTDENTADCTKDEDCGDGFVCLAEACVPKAAELAISAFTGPTDPVPPGETVTLSWQIQSASTAQIFVGDEVIFDIPNDQIAEGSFDVVVETPTQYKLVASDGTNAVEALVSVQVAVDEVTIDAFTATPDNITRGETATLAWRTSHATAGRILTNNDELVVQIDADALDQGSVPITPQTSGTYKLVVENLLGNAEQELTIQVSDPMPVINTFAPARSSIVRGTTTSLQWQVANAETLSISANGVELTTSTQAEGSFDITPDTSTTYTLTVTNNSGTTTADTAVDVFGPLSVTSFTADPILVPNATSTTLAWEVAGDPTSFTIRDTEGNVVDTQNEVATAGSIAVSPTQSTTYTLTVSNPAESVMATVDVTLLPAPPTITTFAADKALVAIGQAVRLNWVTSQATTITIVDELGNVLDTANTSPLVDDLNVVVDKPTTFTLTATNAGGSATADVFVDAAPAPVIQNFELDVLQIAAGEPVTLSWTTSNVTSLTLEATNGPIDISTKGIAADSIQLNPTQSDAFTLTAANATGFVTAQRILIVSTPVAIQTFTATPATVNEGEHATLAWTAVGANAAIVTCVEDVSQAGTTIDTSVLDPNSANVSIPFLESSTCELTLDGFRGPVSGSVSIAVNPTVPRITQFSASSEVVRRGDTITLSWSTANADTITLTDDLGAPVDVSTLSPTGDAVDVTITRDTTYTLTATNPRGSSTATLTILGIDAQNLLINEIFYDALAGDAGLEFIELYNAGDSFIDLQYFSLGAGGANYLTTQVQLAGILPPKGCFVVGGPLSTPENNNATFDIAAEFSPNLQNGGTAADGVALFFDLTTDVAVTTVPEDSVLYSGDNLSALLREDGQPDTEISPDTSGESLHRVDRTDLFVAGPMNAGTCFRAVNVSPSTASNLVQDTVIIHGWALDADLDQVTIGTQTVACTTTASGLACTLNPTSDVGPVDVTVTRINRWADDGSGNAVLVAIDPANQPSFTLSGQFTLQ